MNNASVNPAATDVNHNYKGIQVSHKHKKENKEDEQFLPEQPMNQFGNKHNHYFFMDSMHDWLSTGWPQEGNVDSRINSPQL